MGRLFAILATILIIAIGLAVIFGLALEIPGFTGFTTGMLEIVSITTAVMVLVGVFNLIMTHFGRLRRRDRGWGYSIVLLISVLGVIVLTILERAGVLTGDPAITTILLEHIQVSIESALAGLLLFALVYGAYRVLRHRTSLWGVLFVAAIIIVLAGTLPLPGLTFMTDLRDWLMDVPVSAGARGILLGIALATVVTGVRVLTGQDRSYRE